MYVVCLLWPYVCAVPCSVLYVLYDNIQLLTNLVFSHRPLHVYEYMYAFVSYTYSYIWNILLKCSNVYVCECLSVYDMFAWCAPLPYPVSRHVNKCEFSRAVAFVCTSSLAICTSLYFVHRCIIFRKSVVTLIAYSVC